MLGNGHEITFSYNSTWKTYLEQVCRDTLRPGHPMEICRFKSHKLKVIFGHLLFNVLHSRGGWRYSWHLFAVPAIICKTKNGSKTYIIMKWKAKRGWRAVNYLLWLLTKALYIHVICLELEILPFLLWLCIFPRTLSLNSLRDCLSLGTRWKLTLFA